jgi:hypothetical protein
LPPSISRFFKILGSSPTLPSPRVPRVFQNPLAPLGRKNQEEGYEARTKEAWDFMKEPTKMKKGFSIGFHANFSIENENPWKKPRHFWVNGKDLEP